MIPRAERFSWWFTMLTTASLTTDRSAAKLQRAELDYLLHSEVGLRTIAENYVGLSLSFGDTPTRRFALAARRKCRRPATGSALRVARAAHEVANHRDRRVAVAQEPIVEALQVERFALLALEPLA